MGDEAISKDEFDARVELLQRSLPGSDPRDLLEQAPQFEDQALSRLVREKALLQEAEERDVAVSGAEVRQRFKRARREFKSREAFERFLGGQTEQDLLDQLRVQMLAERVSADMAEEGIAPRSFEEELQRRWRPKTACDEDYSSSACPDSGD